MLLVKNKTLRLLGGALETFSLLSLRLWLKRPHQARSFSGKVFRSYMSLVGQDKWKCESIIDIIPGMKERRIVLDYLPGDGIATPVDELAYLALVTQNLQPKKIFEIGTFRGRTALNFALNSPAHCRVYTLDLPPGGRDKLSPKVNEADAAIIRASETGMYYRGKPEESKIEQLYGDSMQFDFTPFASSMDLVFVDGAHHYESVLSDTRNALKMVVEGGCVLWHDFANYGDYNDVTRAVLDLLPPATVVQIEDTQLAIYKHEPAASSNRAR